MTSLLGAIVRLTESAAKGAGKMALSGAKSAAVKAFQRVGTYSNARLRGPSANTKPATKAPDAIRPSAIRGSSTTTIVDPVAGIDQVISAVNASSDKIARTIDEVNTELQKFLYKRRPSGGDAKKSQQLGEEEDEQKKDRNKPKIKVRPKAKVRPKVKPKARFRRGPKNALTKLKGRNARNALTRLGSKPPRNALTKIGPAASLGASTARPTKLPSAKGVPGGSMLGKIGTALGMYFEFADEMNTTGNVSRGAAAAAGTGAGMMLGGKAGAVAGGALGTLILPGLGTTIGAIAGGLLGGWGGGELGATAGRKGYDAATGFTPGSKGAVSVAGESLVKINDLEYAFSNVIFESRELVFEYNKIERGRQSGAVGFGGGGGSVISVGPDGTIGRVSSGDAGGALFGPRSGGGGSGGGDPSGVIPSGPRDATKNERTRTDNHDHGGKPISPGRGSHGYGEPEPASSGKAGDGYRWTSGYGRRGDHMHAGIDAGLKLGSPVRSGGGKVLRAQWQNGYGNTVDILGDDGVVRRYAHLNKMNVKKGDILSEDHVLGEVGSTGTRSTGPHLHYEERPYDQYQKNPFGFQGTRDPSNVDLEPMIGKKTYKQVREEREAKEKEAAAAKEKDNKAEVVQKFKSSPPIGEWNFDPHTGLPMPDKKGFSPFPGFRQAEIDDRRENDTTESLSVAGELAALREREKWRKTNDPEQEAARKALGLAGGDEDIAKALEIIRKDPAVTFTERLEQYAEQEKRIGLDERERKERAALMREDKKFLENYDFGKFLEMFNPKDNSSIWSKQYREKILQDEPANFKQRWEALDPRPEEPARKTVDEMNVTGPPQVNTLKEKQRHSGLELNDRDDNNIYQTYTEYSNLSKVV